MLRKSSPDEGGVATEGKTGMSLKRVSSLKPAALTIVVRSHILGSLAEYWRELKSAAF